MFFSKIARIKVTAGADASGRNAASSYVRKDGQVCGIVKLVTGWHPIGHTVGLFARKSKVNHYSYY